MKYATFALSLAIGLALSVAPVGAQDEKKEPDLMTRLKKIKGSFTLIASVQVKKGEEKAMIAAARPCIAATLKETGCKRYELHQDTDDPTKFTFVERWDSVKALEEHFAAEHTKKLLAEIEKIAAGPPTISFAKRLDVKKDAKK